MDSWSGIFLVIPTYKIRTSPDDSSITSNVEHCTKYSDSKLNSCTFIVLEVIKVVVA